MKKILSILLSLVLIIGFCATALAFDITDCYGTISRSGTSVTGTFHITANGAGTLGGALSIKEMLPGGTWTTKGGTFNFKEGVYSNSFSYSVVGTYGAKYKLVNEYVADFGGGDYDSYTIEEGTITIPPAAVIVSKWCSASRSGYNVNTTASCTMNQVCNSIKITWSLQKLNESGTWSTVGSKSSTKTNDDAYAGSVSFGITSGYSYRVKATFTCIGPAGDTVTGTSYSGSV